MPIWAMLFAWPFLHVRPTLRDIAALVLGIAAVALLLGVGGFELQLISTGLALSCAILFPLGNALNGKPVPMPPLAVVAWQVRLGCFVMLLIGIAFEHPDYGAITATGIACFAYTTLVPMGLCYFNGL